MDTKEIYHGPSQGLYRPLDFLFFMDQGQGGSNPRPVQLLDFKYGTSAVYMGQSVRQQVWHVHHYGVTVKYELEHDRVTVRLYGEYIPLRNEGILSKPPISEVERIIIEEAKKPRYLEIEENIKR
mgnify:FL=1